MKKMILSLLICISVLCCGTVFAAGDAITVIVNGEVLETPVAPQIVNDRTMVPMRCIFESLGARVTWFEADQIIFATKGEAFIALKIGVPELSVQTAGNEENRSVALDATPYIDSGHTLVPVRAIAEALQATVDWVDETRTVVVTTK